MTSVRQSAHFSAINGTAAQTCLILSPPLTWTNGLDFSESNDKIFQCKELPEMSDVRQTIPDYSGPGDQMDYVGSRTGSDIV